MKGEVEREERREKGDLSLRKLTYAHARPPLGSAAAAKYVSPSWGKDPTGAHLLYERRSALTPPPRLGERKMKVKIFAHDMGP